MPAGDRGQITVEAILILGFFILVFVGVSIPMGFKARNTALESSAVADAKFATEQIAGAANTVLVNGSKRTIDVYVPGYNSTSTKIATRICTDGQYLNTSIAIKSSNAVELQNLSAKLYGSGWSISSGGGAIVEDSGARYTIVITYKDINSSTTNGFSGVDCSTDLLGAL